MRSVALVLTAMMGFNPSYAIAKRSLASVLKHQMDIATVTAPVDGETCFSPDQPCDMKLVKFIESAEKSIEIAIYDINLDQLVHVLLLKSKKIPVRIVVYRRQ